MRSARHPGDLYTKWKRHMNNCQWSLKRAVAKDASLVPKHREMDPLGHASKELMMRPELMYIVYVYVA